jgi:hypothetical protein
MSDATAAAGFDPDGRRGAARRSRRRRDLDIVVVENGRPAHVFLNRLDAPARSLRIDLEGSGKSNRDAIGARSPRSSAAGRRCAWSRREVVCVGLEKTLTFGLGESPRGFRRGRLARRIQRTGAKRGSGRYRWIEGKEIEKR